MTSQTLTLEYTIEVDETITDNDGLSEFEHCALVDDYGDEVTDDFDFGIGCSGFAMDFFNALVNDSGDVEEGTYQIKAEVLTTITQNEYGTTTMHRCLNAELID